MSVARFRRRGRRRRGRRRRGRFARRRSRLSRGLYATRVGTRL